VPIVAAVSLDEAGHPIHMKVAKRYLSALLSAQGAWFEHLNAFYCALLLMGHACMEGAAS
jgi:hypothetical protein